MALGVSTSHFSRDGITAACIELLPRSARICRSSIQHLQDRVKVKWWSNSRISQINMWRESQIKRFSLKCRGSHLISSRINVSAFSKSSKEIHNSEVEEVELPVALLSNTVKQWRQAHATIIVGLVICTFVAIPSADAVDALKTYGCLLKECRVELAKCVANPSCAANIACIEICNGRPDETECQMKCGDLFENKVVDEFNECAVSRKKCVPRMCNVGEFAIPDSSALVKSFNISDFSGKWYITSGMNPTFDTYDCQLHDFHVESNKLVGNLSWRIRTPDGGFFTRSAVQKFTQDSSQPGILYNHDNEYLHYQDEWYILSSRIDNEADDYVFVYYRGRNDAWDGYGGAIVYTRSAVLPETIVPELEKAAGSVGLNFSTFIRTDNTCRLEPPLLERLEKTLEDGELTAIRQVEEIGRVTEKVVQRLAEGVMEAKRDAENFLRGLEKEEMNLLDDLKMEAIEVEKVLGRAPPIRKLR